MVQLTRELAQKVHRMLAEIHQKHRLRGRFGGFGDSRWSSDQLRRWGDTADMRSGAGQRFVRRVSSVRVPLHVWRTSTRLPPTPVGGATQNLSPGTT